MPSFILPCILPLIAIQSDMENASSFLREYSASWLDYSDKINGLQCFVKSTHKHDGIVKTTDQSYVGFEKSAVILLYRMPSPDAHKRLAPNIHLVRVNQGQIEQFRIMSQISVDTDSMDLTPEFIHRKHEWILINEKIVSKKTSDFNSYRMRAFSGGMVDGFKLHTPSLLLPEVLNESDFKITKFSRTADTAEIEFALSQALSKIASKAKCQLKKMGHWLVTSIELDYNPSFSFVPNWFAQTAKTTLEYVKSGELFVPSTLQQLVTLKEPEGQLHSVEFNSTYIVTKFTDESLLKLPTYGIPERRVKPDLPAPIASVDSSAIEGIPLWGWLTAFAVVLLVVGLLLRRGSKTKRA